MDHDEAIRSMASEKYLLRELTPELRDSFEEHFFLCKECGEDVRLGAALLEHGKTVLASAPTAEPARIPAAHARAGFSWWRALAAPALAMVVALVAYQNFTTVPRLKNAIAEARQPRIFPSLSLVTENSRGASQPTIRVRKGEAFLLFVDISTVDNSPSYAADLYSPDGHLEWSLPIPGGAAKETVPIRVPPGESKDGTYLLVVSGVGADGSKRSAVGRYPFALQFEDSNQQSN